jgi:hypothetical protein
MNTDIKALEEELAARLEAIEAARQRDMDEFEQRKRDREVAIAAAKLVQQKEIEAKTNARIARETKQREDYEAWEKAEQQRRFAEEQANLKLQAEREEAEARARDLQDQIAKIEHAEEQRRMALEQMLPPIPEPNEMLTGVNGATPLTSDMSDHLKRILRQDRDFTNE